MFINLPPEVRLYSLLHHTGAQPHYWLAGVKPIGQFAHFCTGFGHAPSYQAAIDVAVQDLYRAIETTKLKMPKQNLLSSITLDL